MLVGEAMKAISEQRAANSGEQGLGRGAMATGFKAGEGKRGGGGKWDC